MPAVFITGAGRRIGRAIAERFAERGWDIAVHYRNSAEGAQRVVDRARAEHGVAACAVQADVASPEAMAAAFRTAHSALGAFTALVNNAGIFPEPRTLEQTDEAFWDSVLDTNLRSQLTASREFLRVSTAQGARIVNFASLGGMEVWRGRIPYNVSKAGVIQLTKALARELAPAISVNAIAPGLIDIPEEPGEIAVSTSRIPMQRYGTVDDIFEAVWFFTTGPSFITGQILAVDGGHSLSR